VKQFKNLVPGGHGYQTLINQALQEWLTAQSVKELLREEVGAILHKAASNTDTDAQVPKRT